MLALLSRPKGARLSELEKITGWQAHSIRAALTVFRHQGEVVSRLGRAYEEWMDSVSDLRDYSEGRARDVISRGQY